MKKIIALFVVLLAFGFSANAQQKKATKAAVKKESAKLTPQQAAKKDLAALTAIVTDMDQTKKDDYYRLFEHKHRDLAEGLSDERKEAVYANVEAKIKAGLSPENIQKLENNPAVLRDLID